MTHIKQYDKRTGITYVYESESYWDKDKQQARSKRRLIGKIDEQTGEIVPTDGRGKKRTEKKKDSSGDTALCDDLKHKLQEKELLICQLTEQNKALKKEKASILKALNDILCRHDDGGQH